MPGDTGLGGPWGGGPGPALESPADQPGHGTGRGPVSNPRINAQPPAFLEKVVLDPPVAMGYAGVRGRADHLGGTGDEGVGGVVGARSFRVPLRVWTTITGGM